MSAESIIHAQLHAAAPLLYLGLAMLVAVGILRVIAWALDRRARTGICPYCGFRTYPDCINDHVMVHEWKAKAQLNADEQTRSKTE